MTRTFNHNFDPPSANPVTGSEAELTVEEIEDAGIREVLQTPGAAYGTWSILDALLAPTGTASAFLFKEPLGQAREVKVALSGLLGRFVTRAYLERYLELRIFAHLGNSEILLDGRRRIKVERRPGETGDLPDWVACKWDLSSLTVAEAKGSHDPNGPSATLGRAWKQAGRVDVTVRGRKASLKRIAVATRWGFASNGPEETLMSVRDPIDEGEPMRPNDEDALFLGLLRRHAAGLIRQLGHPELAGSLVSIGTAGFSRTQSRLLERARSLLDAAPTKDIDGAGALDGLIGGIVARTGPIGDLDVSPADQDVLDRLNLRPVFVGIERDLLRGIIDEDLQIVRKRLAGTEAVDDVARPDRAGGWIVPLGAGRHVVGGA